MKMQGNGRSAAMGSGEGEDVGDATVYGADGVAAGGSGTPDGSYGNGHSGQALDEGGDGTMMPSDGQQAAGGPDEYGMPGLLGHSGDADRPGGGMMQARRGSGGGRDRMPGDGMGGGGGMGGDGGGRGGGSGRDDNASAQVRRCATMEVHRRLLSSVPEYAARRADIENLSQRYELGELAPQRAGITRIPVVVHVVYNTAAQNVSQSQIDSQIAVLNRDFRRTNPDVSTTPAPFLPLAADARIEFELATVDPGGSPTTGVERRHTSVTSFSYEDDGVKSAATGGMNAWPSDRYLNMWVCPLGGLLGYAQFPGGPAHTDGVVINHSAFGTNGTAAAPYNLGRTATHEIGHWLNLAHIWGDDGNGCTGTDHVSDTPNQGGYNTGVPTFPRISCSNGPNGDMFMNYMDYVDDRAMVMFSAGQVARMQACLDGPRSSIGLGTAAIKPSSNPMVAWGPNRLDVFVQGADSVLYHKWWNGSAWGPSATGFQSLGGVCTSVPQAVSWGPNRLDVFVTSTDSALYHKWWNGSAWGPSPSGYEYQGGVCVGEPRALSWGPNRLDVFVVGANRALYHKAWTGSGWWPGVTGFENLGGRCVGQPEVVSWGPNRLDIFVIGTDRALYHKAWTGSAWYPSATGYERLGGICMSAPRAVCWGPNRLDIFVTGTDGALYHKWWNGSAWGPTVDGFERLGGVCVGQPEVVSWGPNRLDIFVVGTDSALYHKWWNGSAWGPSLTGYERQGGILTSPPRAVAWGPNRLDVFATGTDSALYHKAWTGSAWTPSLTGFQYLGGVITSLREEARPEQERQAYAPAPMAMPEMAPDGPPQFIAPAWRDTRPAATMN